MREIRVDLSRITQNYLALKDINSPAKVMAVIKANAYGHGMHEVATALEATGVDMIGVADLEEAFALRLSGIKSQLMCWILQPDEDFSEAVLQNIELGISTIEVLEAVLKTSNPRIHIKVETGLGRNGFAKSQWQEVFSRLQGLEIGLFSHLANTSEVEDLKQQAVFEEALELARNSGVKIVTAHLAATAGALAYPQMRYDMVRCGIGLYGLNPFEDRGFAEFGLRPAMKVVAKVANLKRVEAGQGVSYGYKFVTSKPTSLALIPFGYYEGMPRISVGAMVCIGGVNYPVVGRVAMDQFLVDVGDAQVSIGDEAVIFGDSANGEPSAEDLGASAGTINYEIVTRIGGRAKRVFF